MLLDIHSLSHIWPACSLTQRHFVCSMALDPDGFARDVGALQLARKFRACSEVLWGSTVSNGVDFLGPEEHRHREATDVRPGQNPAWLHPRTGRSSGYRAPVPAVRVHDHGDVAVITTTFP
jgi:hypothetical protein